MPNLLFAVYCSALRYVAVRCGVLQCAAVCCSALRCVAVRCGVLQCIAGHCRFLLLTSSRGFLDGYCSTVQGLLDWFEVDLGFTELLFIQIDLCVRCVFVLKIKSRLEQSCSSMCALKGRVRALLFKDTRCCALLSRALDIVLFF